MQNKIYLKRKVRQGNEQNVIRLSAEAMELLIGIVNETSMSITHVASQIIIQAVENDLIAFFGESDE